METADNCSVMTAIGLDLSRISLNYMHANFNKVSQGALKLHHRSWLRIWRIKVIKSSLNSTPQRSRNSNLKPNLEKETSSNANLSVVIFGYYFETYVDFKKVH